MKRNQMTEATNGLKKIQNLSKNTNTKNAKSLFDLEILQCFSDNYIETEDDDWQEMNNAE